MKNFLAIAQVFGVFVIAVMLLWLLKVTVDFVGRGGNGYPCYPNQTCDAPNTCNKDGVCVIMIPIVLPRQ